MELNPQMLTAAQLRQLKKIRKKPASIKLLHQEQTVKSLYEQNLIEGFFSSDFPPVKRNGAPVFNALRVTKPGEHLLNQKQNQARAFRLGQLCGFITGVGVSVIAGAILRLLP